MYMYFNMQAVRNMDVPETAIHAFSLDMSADSRCIVLALLNSNLTVKKILHMLCIKKEIGNM